MLSRDKVDEFSSASIYNDYVTTIFYDKRVTRKQLYRLFRAFFVTQGIFSHDIALFE